MWINKLLCQIYCEGSLLIFKSHEVFWRGCSPIKYSYYLFLLKGTIVPGAWGIIGKLDTFINPPQIYMKQRVSFIHLANIYGASTICQVLCWHLGTMSNKMITILEGAQQTPDHQVPTDWGKMPTVRGWSSHTANAITTSCHCYKGKWAVVGQQKKPPGR